MEEEWERGAQEMDGCMSRTKLARGTKPPKQGSPGNNSGSSDVSPAPLTYGASGQQQPPSSVSSYQLYQRQQEQTFMYVFPGNSPINID